MANAIATGWMCLRCGVLLGGGLDEQQHCPCGHHDPIRIRVRVLHKQAATS